MAEQQQGGFGSWIRNQFQLPRTQEDWGRMLRNAALSSFGGPLGMAAGFAMDRSGGGMGDMFGPLGMFGSSGPLVMGARGVGTSFGRMFDGDNRTGFFNNPTAPWNNTPRNVPQGHPDFVGPPNPYSGPFSTGNFTQPGNLSPFYSLPNSSSPMSQNFLQQMLNNNQARNIEMTPAQPGLGILSPEALAAAGAGMGGSGGSGGAGGGGGGGGFAAMGSGAGGPRASWTQRSNPYSR